MIDLTEVKSGVIENLFTKSELSDVVELMSKLDSGDDRIKTQQFKPRPIGIGHMLYPWFLKKVYNRIISNFKGHEDIGMIFATYIDLHKPFGVHSDYFHKREHEPCMAVLIPISVDYGEGDIEKPCTVVFNEQDTYFEPDNDPTEKKYDDENWKKLHNDVKENNATDIHQDHLSHVNKKDLEYLTVNNILNWKEGCAIWWDEKYLHSSCDFESHNINNKQFIVLHTYYK